jgi:predicted nucleic acid-binding protein
LTRYVLDTDIISDATRPLPAPALAAWLAEQADEDLFIAPLTIAEIRRGILELPAGGRRRALARWFAGPEGPQSLFAGRVPPFDMAAALAWGRLP